MKKVVISIMFFFILYVFTGIVIAQVAESGNKDEPVATEFAPEKITVQNETMEAQPFSIPEAVYQGVPSRKADERGDRRFRDNRPVEPVWKHLSDMPSSDRMNSILQLELSEKNSQQDFMEARNIEDLWNQGKHEEALESLQQLEEKLGAGSIAVGIQWKKPKPLGKTTWGTDRTVSTQPFPYFCTFDLKHSNGNLFSVVAYDNSSGHWAVNMSTDGGTNWSETFEYTGGTYIIALDAVVLGDYLYVGYAYDNATDEARIRRQYVTDGTSDSGYFYKTVIDKDIDVREIALASSADAADNNVYYFAILNDNSLIYSWSGDQTNWTEVTTGVDYALNGLDACFNANQTTNPYFVYASFFGTDNFYHISRRTSGLWQTFGFTGSPTTTSNWFSSIGAYGVYVFSAFEFSYASGAGVKYYISYDGGANWSFGNFAEPASGVTYWCPDVTLRRDTGIAIGFYDGGSSYDKAWYSRRDYGTVNWSTWVHFNDYDANTSSKPAIEWRDGSDDWGVVYSSSFDDTYIDRLLATGTFVDDPVGVPTDYALFQNHPNPFNPSTRIEFNLPVSSFVKLKIYNSLGQEVDRLIYGYKDAGTHQVTWQAEDVPAGIYLCKLEAGDYAQTIKLVLQK